MVSTDLEAKGLNFKSYKWMVLEVWFLSGFKQISIKLKKARVLDRKTKYVPKRYRKTPNLIIQIFPNSIKINSELSIQNRKTQTCINRYQRQQQYTDKFTATEKYSSAWRLKIQLERLCRRADDFFLNNGLLHLRGKPKIIRNQLSRIGLTGGVALLRQRSRKNKAKLFNYTTAMRTLDHNNYT